MQDAKDAEWSCLLLRYDALPHQECPPNAVDFNSHCTFQAAVHELQDAPNEEGDPGGAVRDHC